MTLQEAKEQVAKDYGANTWAFLLGYQQDQLWPSVCELYARSKWDEAVESFRNSGEIKDNLKQRIKEKHNEQFVHVSDIGYMLASTPKPEFKP
jgi:hypothetical protein